MNIVVLVGNLGGDPEGWTTKGGTDIAKFSMATSRYVDGEERTDWHRIICFGKTANNVLEYLRKGSQVAINGRLQTRTYDKDGETRYMTEVVANSVKFLSKKSGDGGGQKQRHRQTKPEPEQAAADFDDDIPF